MRSSNPLLNEKYFNAASTGGATINARSNETAWNTLPPGAADYRNNPSLSGGGMPGGPGSVSNGATMTMGGVVSATAVMMLFVLVGGWFGWGRVIETVQINEFGEQVLTSTFPTVWVLGSMLVGFGLAIACSFRPKLARILAIPYALAEGVLLGAISHNYDIITDGVALQAVIATGAVFAIMLVLYSMRILRATPKMVKGIMAATFGIMAVYLVGFVGSLFGADFRFWDSASPLGIGISVIIVGVAAFNLILDFDFIERGVNAGLPKEMEWFGAFGLVVTLVWLYLEMLRLLSKLQRR